jgi:hypothetical protein
MTQHANPLQNFWDDILSSDPGNIRSAFASLDLATQSKVLAHLHRMVTEDGWHPAQQASARVALQTLESPEHHPRK